jgi:hypothetical protein
MTYLEKLISLGESATQRDWHSKGQFIWQVNTPKESGRLICAPIHRPHGAPDEEDECNAAYIASLSPHKLLPLLRAAKEMRDAFVSASGGFEYNIENAMAALSAFDAAVTE